MSPWIVAVVALGLVYQWLTVRHLDRAEAREVEAEREPLAPVSPLRQSIRAAEIDALHPMVRDALREKLNADAKAQEAEWHITAAPTPTYRLRCTWVRGQGDDWITDRDGWEGPCTHDPHAPCPRTGTVAADGQPKQAYPVAWGAVDALHPNPCGYCDDDARGVRRE